MKFKFTRKDVTDAVFGVLEGGAKSFVVFCGPLSKPLGRVKVTRRFKPDKRTHSTDLVLTVGVLNYAEREYVKLCHKAKTNPRRVWIKW